MKRFYKTSINALFVVHRIYKRLKMYALKPLFRRIGKNVVFDPDANYSFETIEIGNDVFIGDGADFSASRSSIIIGRKVMFGPNVTIRGGNHTVHYVGKFMYDITDSTKDPKDDEPVIIEDDVWVGSRAIILKGITIGRGSIVGAGSVVTKSVPPYAIVGGVPARIIKMRFTEEEIKQHEQNLYFH